MMPLSFLIKFFTNPKNLIISILTLALITLSGYNYYLSKRVDSLKTTIKKTNTTLMAYKKEVKTLNDNMVTIAKVSTKIKKETLKKEVFTKVVAELPKITETSNGDNNEKYISAYNDLIDPWVQSSNNNSTSQTGPPSTSTTS